MRVRGMAATTPRASRRASQYRVVASACAEACGTGCAASARNTLPNVATPTAWPSCSVVVNSPLASAASRTGTCRRECVTSGLNPSASEAPSITRITCNIGPPCVPDARSRPSSAYAATATRQPTGVSR